MHHLTMGICSEKGIVSQYQHCAYVIDCIHANLEGHNVTRQYNLVRPPSYMQPIIDLNFLMQYMAVFVVYCKYFFLFAISFLILCDFFSSYVIKLFNFLVSNFSQRFLNIIGFRPCPSDFEGS
jgi:hypothetical protein